MAQEAHIFEHAVTRALRLGYWLHLPRDYGVNEDVRLTVYPEAGHDSWTEAYNNPELYAWLLSHSR